LLSGYSMIHVLLLESHVCITGSAQSRESVWATLRPSCLPTVTVTLHGSLSFTLVAVQATPTAIIFELSEESLYHLLHCQVYHQYSRSHCTVCQHCWYNVVARSLHLYILTEGHMATSNLHSDVYTSVSVISKPPKHTYSHAHTQACTRVDAVFILWYFRQPAVWVTFQDTPVLQPAMSLTSTRTCLPPTTTWSNWYVIILNSCHTHTHTHTHTHRAHTHTHTLHYPLGPSRLSILTVSVT
jgi:hypothetical protein